MSDAVTTPTRWSRITVALGVTVAAALFGARCSDPPRRGYDLTAVFDEQTKPTLPGESRSELRLLGAAPDGTLYIETYVPPAPTDTVWVRSPTGSYPPAPAELGAENVEAMAFDPVTGDLFVLSYPEGRAHIRRFHGDRVVQDLVPTNPAGGNFEENSNSGGDTVGLFYDSSSGSLFYADGSLYLIDANGAATVTLSRPAPPDEVYDAAGGPAANRDYSVAYALNPKTGVVYVAFFSLESTGKCLVGDVVYRLEANGQLTHVVGGCVKGKDDVITDRLDHLVADPTSEDLVT
ncbi:MAG: hypothetical protein L0Z49_12280, partial [Actinobacteria bacterium]|nr:hypothetical protein [Actinomycetota bacterium]